MPNFQKIADGIQLAQLPTSNRPSSPTNGMLYYDSTLNKFQKYENGSWADTSSGAVSSPSAAHNLALYPSTSASVSDTDTQNGQSVKIAIAQSGTRSAGLTYNFPNPGDAVTSADVVLTQGTQTIAGAKTFSNDVVMNGNLTVNGTTTFLNTTNTQITDALITLNKGGATASGGGSGFEVEENSAITGYFKVSAARTGFDMKAPATAGVATFITDSTSRTYTLPAASGTLMTAVVQDTAPQLGGDLDVNGHLIKSASNGNISIMPNGTGKLLFGKSGAPTRYIEMDYIDAISLSSPTTAVVSSLTFDTTVYKSVIIEYSIVEATTNRRRTGKLYLAADGASSSAATTVNIVDTSVETADVGVSFSVAMSTNNAQISATTTGANAKTMQVRVKRFLA